ncbi:hypothetical protein [Sulfitobacter guttiformis]|uniref:Uncharacterized protein n=1 Tax=Sulfitobacter guttiformis TaxID=74349 RepID=A0A420DQ31_9RHOB|nr:hypothetical protein [Sulfitobacter guttiformis]KIN73777.1 hypothetical protein Z949_2969 [Sulfitobacter guttiformis KCTC 32187]RKE96411.1 hypothetical protein C8N30_0969 [Sulfitobacter guttiformis]
MVTIDIPRNESGTIRVFAISRPMADMARAVQRQGTQALGAELLGHEVKSDEIELFALSDLAGVGLHGYLSEGYDIDKFALQKDFRRLKALDGYVLLHFSRLGATQDITLSLHSDLTLIGSYAEPKPLHTGPPITAASAELYSGARAALKSPARSRLGSILTGVIVLLLSLFIWWILR